MIEFRAVSKAFQGHSILKNLSFKINQGEKVSILGPGGCGKTTVLKIAVGLVPPDTGSCLLANQDIYALSEEERIALMTRVGVAFQQGALFDFMTVRENLIFAMEHMTKFTASEMEKKVESLLEAVKLSRTGNMYPYELSGGMKRRVGIARALCTEPDLAIFDEPTSGLDPVTSTIILNMILDLARDKHERTLVVATNNVEIAIRFAERVILIHEEKIVADGPWRELILTGSEWVQTFLSVRFIGLDKEYAQGLDLPKAFMDQHWTH